MTQSKARLTAMTAIVAVLALASPAMAQDAVPAPATTPDPLGATPPTVAPSPPTEPAPSTVTTADPLSVTTAVETTPAPAASTRARMTPRRATTTAAAPARSVTRARPAPRATAAASITPATPATVAPPAPTIAPLVAATPPPAAAPTPVEAPQAAPIASVDNDVLPLAAAGGLGLLALLGTGVALRRRKRRDEEVDYAELDEPMFDAPKVPIAFAEPMREPSMKRVPAAAAASTPVDAPAQALPEGFDLSRFGAHVQAAYRGPTDDNPSLSLKNRLRRASAMDQMARTSDTPAAPPTARPLAAATAARDTGAVVSKMRPAPSASSSFLLGGDSKRPALTPVTQH